MSQLLNPIKNKKYRNDIILFLIIIIIAAAIIVIRHFTVTASKYVQIFYNDSYDSYIIDNIDINDDGYYVISFDKSEPKNKIDYSKYDNYDEAYLSVSDSDEYNIFQIKDSNVDMLIATCKDKVCVNTKKASLTGDSIICLPHNLIISVISNKDENGELDAVAW